MTPLPDTPGVKVTSLFNPELWARIPSTHVRYALKEAAREIWGDYAWLARRLVSPPEAPEKGGAGAAHDAEAGPGAGVGAGGGLGPLPPSATAEEVRAASLRVAKRVISLSQDADFQARLAAASAHALRTARDCLDEFLLGYVEGKNAEIRAYVEEQAAAAAAAAAAAGGGGGGGGGGGEGVGPQDFVAYVRGLRDTVSARVDAAQQQRGAGQAEGAGAGTAAGPGGGVGRGPQGESKGGGQ